jgi:hypothetical protein
MLKTQIKVKYYAFGLRILSEIQLPELPEVDFDGQADVIIEISDLSKLWNKSLPHGKKYIAKENFIMFKVNNTAMFCIQNGSKIIISPEIKSDFNKIRLYILGTCMGALLIQKKIFPLHGSAIAIEDKAYVFLGDRGAGKSTLAATFLSKGYRLLSDDLATLHFNEFDHPYVIPSYPQQKLWETSLNHFDMPSSDYKPLFERETKYAIPIHSQFVESPLPLVGIFELVKTDQGIVQIEQLKGVECLKTLHMHTYRNFLIPQLGLLEWHFCQSTKIIKATKMYRLQRSETSFSAFLLADMILDTIEGGKQDVNAEFIVK